MRAFVADQTTSESSEAQRAAFNEIDGEKHSSIGTRERSRFNGALSSVVSPNVSSGKKPP
ncbi:hypothetical protein [Dyella mobilis]|uniref:Uncharacterized protein n=1 Tax=Dyella mobilis TaxID=1849582 RepID=A0ABS2KH07_9GAMM|nr:hypothetical protein [Dyella mobilis]MBM7130198.1 hypothetical protein [Dyella mobilis]